MLASPIGMARSQLLEEFTKITSALRSLANLSSATATTEETGMHQTNPEPRPSKVQQWATTIFQMTIARGVIRLIEYWLG